MNPLDLYRWESETERDNEDFEKIRRLAKPHLPVGSGRPRRSMKDTDASRRVRKRISRELGGIHRRRQRKTF